MPIPHARRMNLIALALLITALIGFVCFHFMVVDDDSNEMGWEFWPSLIDFLKDADFEEVEGMIAAAAFLSYTLLVAVTPFAITALCRSRAIWWLSTIASGSAMCGLGGVIIVGLMDASGSEAGPGLYCLLGSLLLNFLGLLFIRREVPAAPEMDPA